MRLEFIGALAVLSAALFAVIGKGSINPGLVGLSLTFALEVSIARPSLIGHFIIISSKYGIVFIVVISLYSVIIKLYPMTLYVDYFMLMLIDAYTIKSIAHNILVTILTICLIILINNIEYDDIYIYTKLYIYNII